MLVFRRCGWWCWPEDGPTPENERNSSFLGGCGWKTSFLGVVVASERSYPPKTSMMARFWEVVSGSGRLECN